MTNGSVTLRRTGGASFKAIARAVDGADDARLGEGSFSTAFAKLRDVLVEGTAFGEKIDAPNLVGEGVAVHHLATAIKQEAQDFTSRGLSWISCLSR
jgi:hypothetical protein